MLKVLILNANVTSRSKKMLRGYEDLYQYAAKHGIEFCRSPVENFDPQLNIFSQAQFFDGRRWRQKSTVTPDIIFDKSPYFLADKKLRQLRRLIEKRFLFFNDLRVSELFSDKWQSFLSFRRFSPATVLIRNSRDFAKARRFKSKRVILKPLSGSGGAGIEVFLQGKENPIRYPFIMQELIDSRAGIRGLTNQMHDLRVMVAGEKPFYAYLRFPPKGSHVANVRQGGSLKVVPVAKLPASVRQILKAIAQKIKKFGTNIYAVDLIFDARQKPWIVELNSRPGVILEEAEMSHRDHFYRSIIKFIKEISHA